MIFTDSMSAIQALKGNIENTEDKILFEIKYLLHKLEQLGYEVQIFWIPSHIGIEGNEKVDSLAKRACKEGFEVKNYFIQIFTQNTKKRR